MKKIIVILLLFGMFNTVNAQTQVSLKVGQEAPPVKFNKSLDKALASNFYQNKVLVLDFWATWCAPCIASFPHFNSLSAKFKSEKILFATITDEPEITAVTFFKRTQKKVDAFRLIDTSKVTSKTFGAVFIPFCVVIDQNNKVRWKGNTADLTAQLLQEIIDTPSPAVAPEAKALDLKAAIAAAPKQRPAIYFQFSVTKGTPGGSWGGSAVGSSQSDFYAIDRSNTTLGDFLGEVAGYSKVARFTTNDTLKLNQLINIDYTSPYGKGNEKFASAYADRFIPKKPRTNYLIFLLQNGFNFDFKIIEKEATVYEMVVVDQKKLESFKSLQKGHASFSDDYFPKFEIVGYKLKAISEQLESSFKKIIVDNNVDDNSYDLSLDISSLKMLNQTLLFHGLQLKEVTTTVKMVDIKFN
jgi:thiol-disulfide isomerase/thioredoxin